MTYVEQTFALDNVQGLSAKQLEVHLKLYAGYVKNVNTITAKIAELMSDSEANALALSELKRRFGFEFNGMRLHELYFESLGGDGQPNGTLVDALSKQWGSFEAWAQEFKAIGMMRGIGWVLLTLDPKTSTFHNVWVSDHELGHLAGLPVILAMDMWEHAFMVDYMPAQKSDYINAFMQTLNWEKLNSRFAA
ncbi:MAG: Fe-Mn family superoxide dismutase [Patescibacteria group bacterium]